jgi:hypothetical protein
MTTLTEWIDQAQSRADTATDGPWAVQRRTPNSDVNVTTEATDPALAEPRFVASTGDPHYDGTLRDAEFIAAARTNLPKALDGLRAALDPSTARRIVAMSHQITPEELAPEDLWLVQEIEQIIAATIATALGVTP